VQSPYEAPRARGGARPAVIVWFRAYAALSATIYAGAAGTLAFTGLGRAPLLVALIAFAVVHAAASAVPFKPWGWTLGLVTLGLGLASFTVVVALPLAIAWNKPLVRAAFGRLR
jgi:hypothetical protein